MIAPYESAQVPQGGGWRRVTVHDPCPVCEHDSWCTVAPDKSAVRCKRVESPRPRPGDDGDAWLHVMHGQMLRPRPRPLRVLAPARPDLAQLAREFQRNATAAWIEQAANHLGVTPKALLDLGAGSDQRGNLAIPMHNASRTIVGIRLRTPSGRKFAVAGGREGLFLRVGVEFGNAPLLLPEGPTSSAAALTLGFEVIGRPSCSGGAEYTAELARGRDCVVLADADSPGQRGAEALAHVLVRHAATTRVITPPAPHKDLRDWLKAGACHSDIEAVIANTPVRRLTLEYRHV